MDNLVFEKHYQESGFASQRRYPNEALIRFLATHYFPLPMGKRAQVKILEIGCGSGANLWVIAREGFATYGVDIAPTSLALCKQMLKSYGATATLSVGTMQKLDFETASFDAIVDVMTVEHTDLEGHRATYQEVFRCLKKGGRFFSWHLGAESVSFTKGKGKKLDALTLDNVRNTKVPYSNSGVTCFITARVQQRLLVEAGFTNIRIERVTRSSNALKQETEYFSVEALKS